MTKAERLFQKIISRDSRFSNNVLENSLRDGLRELEQEMLKEQMELLQEIPIVYSKDSYSRLNIIQWKETKIKELKEKINSKS